MMPWDEKDAYRHTRKADTPKKAQVWAKVANTTRLRTRSDSQAIREANAAVARMGKGKRR